MSFLTSEFLFTILPPLLMLVGYLLVFMPHFLPIWKKWQLASIRKQRGVTAERSVLFRRTEMLLELSFGKTNANIVYTFQVSMFALFLLTGFILRVQGFSFFSAVVSAMFLPLLVIAYLRIRIFNNRVKISYEGLNMITELINNYRIQHRNLLEAIEYTVPEIQVRAPLSRDILLNLLYRLRDAQNEKELRTAVDGMIVAMDTSWAKQLANLFKIALIRGDDITDGLIEIQKDLAHLDELGAQKKRLNLESKFMIFGLLPMLLFGSVFGFIQLFDFTFEQYIEYQFRTPLGFKMFFVMFVMCGSTFLMYKLFTQSKNDY